MSDTLKDSFRKKIIPVQFERSIGLMGATTIGVGALMGAGVYVLIGLAAREAGPSVWLSYMICGGLAYLTTLLYAEMAKLVPVSGGGYAYAYDSLGSLGGFATGWFLALGSIFACGLYATGFAEYFTSILGFDLPPFGVKAVALFIVVASTFLNTRGTQGADKIQSILTWGNMGVLTLLIGVAAFAAKPDGLTPVFATGYSGTFSAISIIYISFFGYQLIANNTDEIKDPTRTVPLAMKLSMGISLVFYVLVAFIAIMVVPWEVLAGSNAPLVLVAIEAFGPLGFILIALGGVLASAGALNSTLLSQGRQIYAMGKNRFIPAVLGSLNEARKTPVAALYGGGAMVLLMLLLFDLEFIAKSANFCLLVSLLPISLSLRKIYRNNPDKRPKALWKKVLPEATLLANFGLLMTLDWVSLLFGVKLGLIGFAIYFFYGRKREGRSKAGMNIVLTEPQRKQRRKGRRILVPLSNPKTQTSILRVSGALVHLTGSGGVNLLKVVLVPEQTDFYTALQETEIETLDGLIEATRTKEFEDIPIIPIVRASHHLAKGIVHAAEEEGCEVIIMGYSGGNEQKSATLMEQVIHHTKTDTVFLKLKGLKDEELFSPKKIAVSVGGGGNLPLMLDLAGALADQFGGRITFLHILPESYTAKQRQESIKTLTEALEGQYFNALFDVTVLSSGDALQTLVDQSANFDLLITGTSRTGLLQQSVIGSFAIQLAENAHCSVALVRVVPKAKKIVSSLKN